MAGSLPPWFARATAGQLGEPLTALLNASIRQGELAEADALSIISAIPKAGAEPGSCDGLRGIAVGTLVAKILAGVLE